MSPPVTWNAKSPSSQAMTTMAPMSASMFLLGVEEKMLPRGSAGLPARSSSSRPSSRGAADATQIEDPRCSPVRHEAQAAIQRPRRLVALIDLQLDRAHARSRGLGQKPAEERPGYAAAPRLGRHVELFDEEHRAAMLDACDAVGEPSADDARPLQCNEQRRAGLE